MKIAILYGGNSPERAVSLCSGRGVAHALLHGGEQIALCDPAAPEHALRAGWTEDARRLPADAAALSFPVGGGGLLPLLPLLREADAVLPMLHGGWGEDGSLQAFLDLLGIPYTGSGRLASCVAMDKSLSKRLLREGGIPTAPWLCFSPSDPPDVAAVEAKVGFPCVLKPAAGGSSIGVRLLPTPADLPAALSALEEPLYLLEAYLFGRELSVSILDGGLVLPPAEITAHGAFYDYGSKYEPGGAEELCPASLTPAEQAATEKTALAAFRCLGLRGYGRVDLILSPEGIPVVLEANTLPGMTETSLLPRCAAAAGIGYEALCRRLLSTAGVRRQ